MLKRLGILALLALQTSIAFAATPYYQISFPRDEAAHVNNIPVNLKEFMEWWYLNGRLLTDEGKRLGYDVSMLNSATRNLDHISNQSPLLRIQVSLLDGKKNYDAETHFVPNPGQFSSDNLDIQVNQDYQLKKTMENGEPAYILKAKSDESNPRLQIDLKLHPDSEPFLANKNGYVPTPEKTSTYNYTIPHMRTTGTIRINGQEYHISKKNPNDSMMGHQWGDNRANNKHYGWEVFNIKLENGLVANIYLDLDMDSRKVVGGLANVILPNGEKRFIPYNEFQVVRKNYWYDKKNKKDYPLTFSLSIPSIGLEMTNTALFPEQTVASFWHGFCNVRASFQSQSLKGFSFTELVYA